MSKVKGQTANDKSFIKYRLTFDISRLTISIQHPAFTHSNFFFARTNAPIVAARSRNPAASKGSI
jgi:hypothetical protein